MCYNTDFSETTPVQVAAVYHCYKTREQNSPVNPVKNDLIKIDNVVEKTGARFHGKRV